MRSALLFGIALLTACASVPSAPTSSEPQAPREVSYREVDGRQLKAYVFEPEGKATDARRSAVLLVHGGGWSMGEPAWTFDAARRFAALGMVAVPIEYRLSDDDTTPIDALADVCAAFQWVRQSAAELRVDPDRIAGYGVSAGGHLLASTVTVGCPDTTNVRSTPDALLLISPALDLGTDAWFERKLLERAQAREYSPVDHVDAKTPPTNIVIGTKDTLTPLSGAKRYCERVNAAGGICELNVFNGLGHLLTRNLANQESDFDPDPEAREAGFQSHLRLLERLRFIDRNR